ncbi:MAG: DUF433 domain-containing protein [Chloroflexota bacterium]|nr:DUF433 domain-containing protein [Chloroflexota bacterium]
MIRGTRIPVEIVLAHLALDVDLESLLAAYPRLTPDDVRVPLVRCGTCR